MIKSIFKKSFILLLAFFFVIALVSCGEDKPTPVDPDPTPVDPDPVQPEEKPTYENQYLITEFSEDDKLVARGTGLENAIVVFHYHRDNNDYKRWGLWAWQTNGKRYEIAGVDEFGVYYKIDLGNPDEDFYHATNIGYIYFLPNWEEKDRYAGDRFLQVEESMLNDKNEIHVYSFEGTKDMYLSSDMINPIQVIDSAMLSKDAKSIVVQTNTYGITYNLYIDGELNKTDSIKSTNTIKIPITEFDITKDYKVGIIFNEGAAEKFKSVNIFSYYDTTEFNELYNYDGDLGIEVLDNKTTFKLWAPISAEVSVQIWDAGHPTSLQDETHLGDDEAVSYNLTKGEKGVWSVTVEENLYGKYYTYTVKNGSTVTENIVDPYAKAAGLNGLRGMILDFETTNPENWDKEYSRPYKNTELVVYETHVRDLSTHESWNGSEANRGKYLGLSEAGTTYTANGVTVKTGFDHIKELGVNAIQILPFFDQANDELSDTFNWGYNPQNYNVLEGQYSSDPYNGEVRVKEFKQMVQAYREAGIEVIMDVVYNHMNSLDNSSFHKIVPGYFFRYDNDGNPSNGSGCGNETASDRYMFRKYMIDSTEFWTTEYNLSGFRFDLMGLHDIATMNELAKNLHEIDENIAIYGEPWTGGSTPLAASEQAVTSNVSKLVGVGAFNDEIRDEVKGSVFAQEDRYYGGWISNAKFQEKLSLELIMKSIKGTFFNSSSKQLNYVSCHDNHTLYDRLRVSVINRGNGLEVNFKADELDEADVLAQGIVLTSSGVAFMLNGEELLRMKNVYDEEGNVLPLFDEKYVPTGVSHNSYNLPDETNQIDWNWKIQNIEVFNAYQKMIQIRNEHNKLFNSIVTTKNIGEAYEAYVATYQYNPSSTYNGEKILVICGNINANETYTLDGEYELLFSNGDITINNDEVHIGKLSIAILYKQGE